MFTGLGFNHNNAEIAFISKEISKLTNGKIVASSTNLFDKSENSVGKASDALITFTDGSSLKFAFSTKAKGFDDGKVFVATLTSPDNKFITFHSGSVLSDNEINVTKGYYGGEDCKADPKKQECVINESFETINLD